MERAVFCGLQRSWLFFFLPSYLCDCKGKIHTVWVKRENKYYSVQSKEKHHNPLFKTRSFSHRDILSKRQEDGQREREIHWQLLICLSSSQNISADTLRLIQHDTSCLDSMPGLPVSVISDSKSHRHTEICLDGEGLQSAQHNIGFLLGSYSRNWIYWRNHISSVYYLKITLQTPCLEHHLLYGYRELCIQKS